jgi:hypothetical protein
VARGVVGTRQRRARAGDRVGQLDVSVMARPAQNLGHREDEIGHALSRPFTADVRGRDLRLAATDDNRGGLFPRLSQ